MKFGVCAGLDQAAALAEAGFDFIEGHVQNHLCPEADASTFQPLLEALRQSPLPCAAANCFLPGHLKVTGPDADAGALRRYVTTAFERAQQAGIAKIVFGSGGARAIPEGWDRDVAGEQLLAFGRMLGPLADRYDITVVVEPLNRGECNVFVSVPEGAAFVKAVDHPRVRLLVDAYHWAKENETAESLVACLPLIEHAHIATYASRKAPGLEDCDFSGFFGALKQGGYDATLSIEGGWADVAKEAPEALNVLKTAAGV